MGVHKKATNAAIKAELGRRPLLLDILSHSVKYWLHLCHSESETFVQNSLIELYRSPSPNSWANLLKLTLSSFDLENVWLNWGTKYKNKTIWLLKQSMNRIHDANWQTLVNLPDSKLRTYKTFKEDMNIENYLLSPHNISSKRTFTKLRISAHKLHIETGRYTVPKKTPIEKRTCQVCKENIIENEEHFIMECNHYFQERQKLFNELSTFTIFNQLTQTEKFNFIMSYNHGDMDVLNYVLDFINFISEKGNLFLIVL